MITLSDLELLELVKINNEEAKNFLILRYLGMLPCVVVPLFRKCSFCGIEYEEMEQQGRISSIEALNSYDDSKGSFFNYWYNVVYRALLSILRKKFSRKEATSINMSSLDNEDDKTSFLYRIPDSADIVNDFQNKEEMNNVKKIIKEVLNSREK